MTFEQSLTEMLRDPLAHLGYKIVCIQIHGDRKKTIDVSIEQINGEPVTIEDCVKANREISTIFDVENPIRGAYILQVASPGLDRPLVCQEDFERFAGQEVKITLHTPLEGRRKFSGCLQGIVEDKIQLKIQENEIEQVISFSFNDIQKARLVPSFKF